MKIKFKNRLEAINWIAEFVENEGQFEILREQLIFNEIYSGNNYLIIEKMDKEVIMLDKNN